GSRWRRAHARIRSQDTASALPCCSCGASRFQRALKLGCRELHTAFALRQPVALAAVGRQRTKIHLAAGAAEGIGELLRQGGGQEGGAKKLSWAATSHVTGTLAFLPNSAAAAFSVCGAQT